MPRCSGAALDKLNKTLNSRLVTCKYIIEYGNILLTRNTRNGKRYLN